MNQNNETKLFDKNFIFDYSSTVTYTSGATDYGSIFNYNNNVSTFSAQDSSKLEPYYSRIIRNMISLLCATVVIITLPLSIWFCIKKVPSLERIVVFRLGVLQKVKGPGYVIILPCVDHYFRIDLRSKSFQIPKSQILTRDGGIVELEAKVNYQLVDVVQSVLQVNKINDVVQDLAKQCLVSAITNKDQEYLEKQSGFIEADIRELLNKSTLSWGLEVTRVELSRISILKAAEPQTAMSTLVSTLRSAIGCNEEPESHPGINYLLSRENSGTPESVLEKLRVKIEDASLQGLFFKIQGMIKLLIEDLRITKFIVLRDGKGWLEDFCESQVDVTVNLTSNSLSHLIDGIKTPYQSYADGSLKVEGDYNLLITVAQQINQTQNVI